MQQSDRALALELPLFAGLPATTVDFLLECALVETLDAGERLFNEGEPARAVHILMSGIVEISKLEQGNECAVMLFTPGDVFMAAAALFEEPHLTTATVLSPARVLTLPGEVLRERTTTDAVLAMRIARLIGGQWRMAVRNIVDLKCRTAPRRLASFLLRLADQAGPGEPANLPISKQRLASRVGISPETLSRTLQLLARNGLHLRGSTIIVNDRDKIDRFCGPEPFPRRDEAGLGVNAL